ncbi:MULTISPECIES: NAD(P)-dependent oxidoreductase [unclassified Beijerinckia]|uniref:NAD(P)-dependent oxidoreductase n=1 Tax=unclassified Beijerinckia TaxID=2638183 RepID=UPI000897C741|nr:MULTISPECIES: NAD(P)-dependent oxidoreductase [unclassified Beijerinckia]MDH7798534.1 3-hydroxyisobutyrate dehydrogenase-like beta-hydroxyacid dehydrogenase [Beijerinckia sp. GAS462]SED24097.1 2-hydroxy-3-oxopropionate reductase [Beijerinckia sp. 28-YEA-48]
MSETIGFIGAGALGGALARKLLQAGQRLTIYDNDAAACQRMSQAGATIAASARAVADTCEIAFACLPKPAVSRTVADEITGASRLRLLVECSTLGVKTMREISADLAPANIAVLDCPVTGAAGGPRGVDAGTFAFVCAGSDDIFARVQPLLRLMTSRIHHVGTEPGMAQIAKVINNALSITALTISCEAIVMGVKAGLDPRALIDAINDGSGRNSATVDKFPRSILPRDFASPMTIGVKDMQLYMETIQALGLPAPLGTAVMEIWDSAYAENPQRGYNSIVEYFEQPAGVEVSD